MHGWGMGRCLVVVVLAGGVGGGAYGCGCEERSVVVCEWGGGVSVRAECVRGGVDGCSCVGGGGAICAGGWSWVRRVVWDGGCVSVGRCSLVMSVDGRAVVGTGRVRHCRWVGGVGWRDRVCGSYWGFRWWCHGEGSGGGRGCVGHGVWLRDSGRCGHR